MGELYDTLEMTPSYLVCYFHLNKDIGSSILNPFFILDSV